MAKNNALVADKARGSAGNVTFANWKGIDYFKQKAESVSNPQTDAQRTQRTRMRIMVATFRTLYAILYTGFREMAIKMSAYNAFIKFNIETAVTILTPDTAELDYANLRIAKGSLGQTDMIVVQPLAAGSVVNLTWDGDIQQLGQSATDGIMVLVYNETQDNFTVSVSGAPERADEALAVVCVGPLVLADVVHIYTFFYSKLTNKVSDSTYNAGVVG